MQTLASGRRTGKRRLHEGARYWQDQVSLWLQQLLLLLVPTLLDQHSTLTKCQINHVDIRYPYTLLLSPHLNTLERLKLFNALLRHGSRLESVAHRDTLREWRSLRRQSNWRVNGQHDP
jgi:hypothetical protein